MKIVTKGYLLRKKLKNYKVNTVGQTHTLVKEISFSHPHYFTTKISKMPCFTCLGDNTAKTDPQGAATLGSFC